MKSGKRTRRINKKKELKIGVAVQFKGSDRRGMFKGMSEDSGLARVLINTGCLVEVPLKNIERFKGEVLNEN